VLTPQEVHEELTQFGPVEEMEVCDNVCEHLIGNVYVKFRDEDDAQKALQALSGRFYAGHPPPVASLTIQ
jgi:splicing factor U2AF 35 kDa subunit